MAVTTIPWGDGTNDNIYLSRNASEGNQTVEVSSDANTGAARSKTVTFSAEGVAPVTLTVNQLAGVVEHTLTVNLSSYDSTDKSYYNITGASNAYTAPDSTTLCGVVMKRGASADTWVYFKFDTSELPADATIVSVECKAKVQKQSANANYIASAGCVMCSGTTVKTESVTVAADAYIRTFTTGNWSLAELEDVRIKLYGTRGTSNTSNNYILRMYGAELTIKYTTPQ